jgi:hypothetical protein
MSLHSVYICEDFEIGNGILTIWEAKEVGKVKDMDGYNRLYEILISETGVLPNAIICPNLFHNSEDFDIILFE